MKYIIITVGAIAVNVIIIYMLGNKVAGLRLRSLMMCGLCAFLTSLALSPIIMDFTSFAGKIGFYAILTIILAGLVVYYDEIKENASVFKSFTAIGADSLSELEVFKKDELEDKGDAGGSDTILVDDVTENVESTRPYNSSSDLVIEAETLTTFVTSESQLYSELILEPIVPYKVYGQSSIAETTATKVETIISSEVNKDELAKSCIPEDDMILITYPEDKHHEMDLVQEHSKDTNLMGIIKSPIELDPASDSLDYLLECAFSYKERGEDSDALATFQYALIHHRDKGIAPLLVIEIANLLKNRGAYDEAIVLLIENRNLPGLHDKQGFDQDFVNTIAYLRIIKNTLSENSLGNIPISKIPDDLLNKIDDEFHNWRNFR